MKRNKYLILITILIISFMFFITNLFPQSRGVRVRIKNLNPNNPVGKQYVVLIGINKYQHWNALRGPVKDAKEIGDILNKHYYIDKTLELYDEKASKGGIIKLFKHLQKELKRDDSLLIFYAGHGHLDRASNTGYWIPIDGGNDEDIMDKWIPNSLIRGLIGKIRSKHILLISDSCFSGDILNPNRAKLPKISNNYFKQAYMRRSRQVLTSGASETVPDTSVFARQLKLALKENKSDFIDPMMLYNQIRLGMHSTMPMFGELKGTDHQMGGSFLLFKRSSVGNTGLNVKEYKKNMPPDSKIDLTKFKEKANKLKLEKKRWKNWQLQFSQKIDEAKKLDLSDISSSDKKTMWEGILGNYSVDNPYSKEDERLRQYIKSRIGHWTQSTSLYDMTVSSDFYYIKSLVNNPAMMGQAASKSFTEIWYDGKKNNIWTDTKGSKNH